MNYSYFPIRSSFFFISAAIAPNALVAQDFTWDVTPDAAVVGGSGILDQGESTNFQSPDGQPNQTFSGDAGIAFTALGRDGNVVTVEGVVSITGLRFDVDGYTLTAGGDGPSRGAGGPAFVFGEDTADIVLNNGSGAMIDVGMVGQLDVSGDGQLELSGDQSGISRMQVQSDTTLLFSGQGVDDLVNFGTTINSGRIGDLTNFGTFTNLEDAEIEGDAVNQGGTMNLAGTVGGILSNDGGQIDAYADLTVGSDLVNTSGLVVISDGETEVVGLVINEDEFVIETSGALSSDVVNDASGSLLVDGLLNGSIESGGDLDISGAVSGDALLDQGSVTTLLGTIGGDVENDGLLTAGGGASIGGDLVNTSDVTLAGNRAGDRLAVGGDVSGGGNYALDLDLSGSGTGDRVVVGGATEGAVNLSFNIVNQPDTAGAQSILVFDVNETEANDFTFTASGLPPSNATSVYSMFQDGENGDLFVLGQVNPGITSVASNIVLTQSLIGAIVNRPTSPFVAGLAYEDPDPCGAGLWTRVQTGEADAEPGSSNGVSQIQSTVNADYVGYQAGGDFACFRSPDGWDLAFGMIGGINTGQIEQPVFEIDPMDPATTSSTLASVTTTDFSQSYIGLYGTASSGRLSADLQFRLEQTDFDITNEGVGGRDGIGIEDGTLTTDARTLSGAVNYAFPIGETAFAVIPTAGLAITRGTSGRVDFDDGSRLDIGDFRSEVGFAGLTGSWSRIDEDGEGIFRAFVTSTYYSDFSDPITSRFTSSTGETTKVKNETLGSYGELSVGASYLRLAPTDSFGGVKQYVGSVRADARFGDQIDSWGLTAQFRAQF